MFFLAVDTSQYCIFVDFTFSMDYGSALLMESIIDKKNRVCRNSPLMMSVKLETCNSGLVIGNQPNHVAKSNNIYVRCLAYVWFEIADKD